MLQIISFCPEVTPMCFFNLSSLDTSLCAESQCLNDGKCTVELASKDPVEYAPVCDCVAGFIGDFCETGI